MLSPIECTTQILLAHKIAYAAFLFMRPRMAVPERHTTRMGTAKSIYVQIILPFAAQIRHVQSFILHYSDFENVKNWEYCMLWAERQVIFFKKIYFSSEMYRFLRLRLFKKT